MRLTLLLILILGWQQAAQAFFCFNFGTHSRNAPPRAYRTWYPPPPPSVMPYTPAVQAPLMQTSEEELPSIRGAKKSPEIIQGFRFRPLEESATGTVVESPADWRH